MMVSIAVMAVGGFGVSTASEAWQILLFAGLVPGIGFGGSTTVVATVLLARWFHRRLGLAAGVMSSAIPAGQSIFIPLAIALVPVWGWRATYILLGLLLAVVALPVLALLAGEPPRPVGEPRATPAPRPRAGLDVWMLAAGYFGCGFTDQFVTLHLVALTIEAGVDPLAAAGLYSLLMVTGILGSVVSGPLADTFSARPMLAGLYLLRAAALPLLLLAGPGPRLPLLGIFAVFFGLTYIANQAPGTRLVRDRYGARAVGALMGNAGFAHQIGGACGIALGGLSVFQFGSYGLAVAVAAGVALVAALLQLLIPPKPVGASDPS
jgi:predicted MFS family arabinose efflux permease